jgi:hypothetical protein
MKETFIKYNQWLLEEKGVNICDAWAEEYVVSRSCITKKDVIIELARIFGVHYIDLVTLRKPYKRGTNDIALAKGMLVKYILVHDIEEFHESTIYEQVFGTKKHRTTIIHHRDKDHVGEEGRKYLQLSNFIESHNVSWND